MKTVTARFVIKSRRKKLVFKCPTGKIMSIDGLKLSFSETATPLFIISFWANFKDPFVWYNQPHPTVCLGDITDVFCPNQRILVFGGNGFYVRARKGVLVEAIAMIFDNPNKERGDAAMKKSKPGKGKPTAKKKK